MLRVPPNRYLPKKSNICAFVISFDIKKKINYKNWRCFFFKIYIMYYYYRVVEHKAADEMYLITQTLRNTKLKNSEFHFKSLE